jgi:hypothetical protein
MVWAQRLEEKSFASAADRTVAVESVVRHYVEVMISNNLEFPADLLCPHYLMYKTELSSDS